MLRKSGYIFISLPDIKGDGHNSVEDDDVGPEGKEAREYCTPLRFIPRQKHLEVSANPALPDGVSNGQNNSHTNKEGKDLKYKSSFCVYVHFVLYVQKEVPIKSVYFDRNKRILL